MTHAADHTLLGRHEGFAVLSPQEAVVKGVLECAGHVSTLVWSQRDTTHTLGTLLSNTAEREVLAMHRLEVHKAPDAPRGVAMGLEHAASGDLHVVLALSGGGLHLASMVAGQPLPQRAGLVVVMDLPSKERASVLQLPLTVQEPGSMRGIRDAIEPALRMSRASGRGVVIALDSGTLRSGGSVALRPNHGSATPRHDGSRRGSIRWDRTESPLRMARRLELNSFGELPSPGELAPVGYITVGRGEGFLRLAMQDEARPASIPVLGLGLSSPLDPAAVSRLLSRCERVIVLEPAGGAVLNAVRGVAEGLRLQSEKSACVTSVELPDTPAALGALLRQHLSTDDASIVRSNANGMSNLVSASLQPPLVPTRAMGASAMRTRVRQRFRDLLEAWLRGRDSVGVQLDGSPIGPVADTTIRVETWTALAFRSGGAAAVRQSLDAKGTWLHVIVAGAPPRGASIERLAAAFVPPDREVAPNVLRVPVDDEAAVIRAMQEAIEEMGVTLLVLADVDGRWDVDARERRAAETDTSGFRPLQRIVHGVEHFCSPYVAESVQFDPGGMDPELHNSMHVERIDGPWRPRIALRVRPRLEMIEVTRTQAPRAPVVANLPVPIAKHATASNWHMHLAGYRGPSPGIAARVLGAAGEAMGYQVDFRCDMTPVGPGQRAWTQLRFDQHGGSPLANIDAGKADVLLSINDAQAAFAIGDLHVCDVHRTCVAAASSERSELAAWLGGTWQRDHQLVADVEETCRRRFHTSRLADIVLLGAAFQAGWVPLTVDSIQSALHSVEATGQARLREAFTFGRRAAIDKALLAPERSASPIDTPIRRARRWRLLSQLGTRRPDQKLGTLLDRVLQGLPGLAETIDGRLMRGVLVDGLAAATTWGGIDVAQRLADDVLALYRADRADTGRLLTRAAIGPLVESTLLRDPIYVARMAVSPGHRAALRRSLDVRPSRGDGMEIRYLTRLECTAGSRLVRLDVRTSDWIAGLVAALGGIIPVGWRGSPQQRARRSVVRSLVQRATAEAETEYELWKGVLESLRESFEARTLHHRSAQDIANLPKQVMNQTTDV